MPTGRRKAADQAGALVAEIRRYCAAHADPAQVTRYARYFKEGYDAWGLTDPKHPFWNECQRDWQQRYAALGLDGFLEAGAMLFASGKYEEGAIAIRFVAALRDGFDGRTFTALETWFAAGVGNWAHTDVLCGEVISPLIAEGRIPLESLAGWRGARFKYQRRAVPVGMLGLLKKRPEIKPLLTFVRPLMMDSERVVGQGLGWFLREAWKIHPTEVEAFLLEWKDTAPRIIFQYATEKMSPAARNRFRRAKPR